MTDFMKMVTTEGINVNILLYYLAESMWAEDTSPGSGVLRKWPTP